MKTRLNHAATFTLAFALLPACFFTRSASAQGMAGHDMGAMKAVPPPDQLPAPLPMTGIGNNQLTITGKPEAQAWFTQGLNLYHDFWDYESARAFEQAVRLDPQCAMCFWGLHEALIFRGGNDAYTLQALETAKRLKKNASKHEQLYIDAAVAEGGRNDKKATRLYRKLVADDPADNQAKIFLAEELMDGFTDKHEPKPGTVEAIAILEALLKTAPNDSAANHYWIHAMEPGLHPERAIPSAQLLASLAPSSGHMVHMPGHIFYRTGDYVSAEKWFAQSTAVDETYMQSQHIAIDDDWNYVHNLMYGIANLMEEGKLAQATTLSAKLVAARGDSSATLYTFSPRDSMSRLSPQLPVALRTGDWPTVLSLLADAKPDAKLENLNFLAGELKQFATGMNAVETGNVTLAETSSKALDTALDAEKAKLKDAPPEKKPGKPKLPVQRPVMPDAAAQPLVTSLAIMSLELRASLAAASKDVHKAHTLFDEAAKAEKDLGYREPPTYIRPVGETEGVILLRANDPADAHTAYAAALAERPGSGFPLYGMAKSSETAGKSSDALTEYARFLAAWKDADSATPELKHAQEYVAAHPTVAALAH